MRHPLALLLSACLVSSATVPAQTLLTNGAGPGSVTVAVDGWGYAGGCSAGAGGITDFMFVPPGGAAAVPVVCASLTLIQSPAIPGGLRWIGTTAAYGGIPAIAPPALVAVGPRLFRTAAPVVIGTLAIEVEHYLSQVDPVAGPVIEGSSYLQRYRITNLGAATTVSLYRYLDTDIGANFANDHAGGARNFAACFALPPLALHRMVFAYDPVDLPGAVISLDMTAADAAGFNLLPSGVRVVNSGAGHPVAAFTANPAAFVNNILDGDANGDLLNVEAGGTDTALVIGTVNAVLPAGGTVGMATRIRFTAVDPLLPQAVEIRARDVYCSTVNGNHTGAGVAPVLNVNGFSACTQLLPGQPAVINLASPLGAGGPVPYLLFFTASWSGFCGSPRPNDFALTPFGLMSFPTDSILGVWSGGGGGEMPGVVRGAPLISSVPGVAPILGPATGPLPFGAPILGVPGLPPGLGITIQGIMLDPMAPGLVSTTNTAAIAVAPCACL